MIEEVIFDPVNEYKLKFKEAHSKNVEAFFNDLVKESKIDVNKNQELVSQIKKVEMKKNKMQDAFHKIKRINTFLKVILIFIIVAIIFSILWFVLYKGDESNILDWKVYLIFSTIMAVELALFIGLCVLKFKKVNKLIKDRNKFIEELNNKYNQMVKEALNLLQPLFELFNSTDSISIAKKTTPIISLDEYFDNEKFKMLSEKYRLGDYDNNNSMLAVQSGSLVGNPFVIYRRLKTQMQEKIYTGSITVMARHFVPSKNGGSYMTSPEVLTASISRPAPVYDEIQTLVYANEAVPNLSYSRSPVGLNNMDEKAISKYLKKTAKKLNEMADDAISTGASFNLMNNEEFESLFYAIDRNNEVEFRMLFSPLAQKQMINLLKDKEVGYGDDFFIEKVDNLSFLQAENFANFNFEISPDNFYLLDFQEIKQKFAIMHNEYFKHMYFCLAPILSTPLFQQHKPQEYIYPFKYKTNPSKWENESIANSYKASVFAHPSSITRNILKTHVTEEGENKAKIEVTAYGYAGNDRVESVVAVASDGVSHFVPVPWTEYIPVENKSHMFVKTTNESTSNKEFGKKVAERMLWGQFIQDNEISSNYSFRRNRIFSFKSPKVSSLSELDSIK